MAGAIFQSARLFFVGLLRLQDCDGTFIYLFILFISLVTLL